MTKWEKLTVVAMNGERRSSILLKNHVIHRIEDEPTLDMNNSTPRVPILKLSFSGGSYEPNTPKNTLWQKICGIFLSAIKDFVPPKGKTSALHDFEHKSLHS